MSILSRLDVLEARAAAAEKALADIQNPTVAPATEAEVSTLGDRVSAIETEIGSEPAPAPAADPAPQPQA